MTAPAPGGPVAVATPPAGVPVVPGRPGGGAPTRPAWLWPVRLIACAIAVVFVLGGTWSVVGGFFERTTTRTISFPGRVKHVVVDAEDGDVTVRAAAPGSTAVLTTSETHAFAETRVTHQLVAGTLMIKGSCGSGVHFGECSTDLDLVLPEDVSIEVSTDLGRVSVDGMTGVVRATSSLGRIQLQHLRSPQVEAVADLGEVRVQFDTAPMSVRAKADTGSITLNLPDDGSPYRVLTESNGKAQVEVPQAPSAARVIVATASLGSIRVLLDS